MAQNKTIETQESVSNYVDAIEDDKRRADFSKLVSLIKEYSGIEPKMWGLAIVGFGSYHYKYESGREGDAPVVGISSRVNAISLYLSSEFDQRDELLTSFGKHKTGKGCIYIKDLDDIDTKVLGKMVKNNIRYIKMKYP